MFQPPRCPFRSCPRHDDPGDRFYRHHGSYLARCRPRPVPRFRCSTCRRTFSRQTFRMDYRDHRPDLNGRLFLLLASGLGLRQSARILGLSNRCTELKARKIGRHARRLNLNLRRRLSSDVRLQFDEFETYEGRRNTRPLSVPVLIEQESRFIVWAESAPIRPSGTMTRKRLAAIAEDDRRFGRRVDRSLRSVRRTLQRGAELLSPGSTVVLCTDEKATYPSLARKAFGKQRLVHLRTSSEIARMTWNRLFPINHTEAMVKDLSSRARPKSWLVSKKRRWLDIALHVFIAYRNLVRQRFNRDASSPAEFLGFAPRRLSVGEVLSWRQDGGPLSIHPLARNSEAVAAV